VLRRNGTELASGESESLEHWVKRRCPLPEANAIAFLVLAFMYVILVLYASGSGWFKSALARKIGGLGALGFIGALGFVPGCARLFGFMGFFGLLGVAYIAEAIVRFRTRAASLPN
jgi:hypothetical protein